MSSTGKILVVDDDDAFRNVLVRILRREGHDCDSAPDSPTAMASLRSNHYDLLVSDIVMPGNERLQMIEELALQQSNVSIILLTGSLSLETAIRSVRLPVHAYLTKPLDLPLLRKAVIDAIIHHRLFEEVQDYCETQPDQGDRAGDSLGEWNRCSAAFLKILRYGKRLPEPAQQLGVTDTGITEGLAVSMKTPKLIAGIVEAITVLQGTKQAFKSRQLGALRKRLVALLEDSEN